MRRGRSVAGAKIGGAWQFAATTRSDSPVASNSVITDNTANTTGWKETFCADVGCKNGLSIEGMLLQHSMPLSCPCGEQGIDLQHCSACSGVVEAPQSNAYAIKATATISRKSEFTKRIILYVRRPQDCSQARAASWYAKWIHSNRLLKIQLSLAADSALHVFIGSARK
jgi:hypothetical protein